MTMSMFRCEITLSGDRGKQVRGIAAAQGLSAQDVCEALVIQGINKYYDYMDNAGATEKSSGSGSGSGSDDRFDRISEEIACSRSEVLNDLRNIWAAVVRS